MRTVRRKQTVFFIFRVKMSPGRGKIRPLTFTNCVKMDAVVAHRYAVIGQDYFYPGVALSQENPAQGIAAGVLQVTLGGLSGSCISGGHCSRGSAWQGSTDTRTTETGDR